MDDNVSGFAEHGCGVGNDGDSPGRVRRANYFAEIAAGFCGVFIDGADYFDGAFFPQQADDGGSDGSDPVLDGANFLFLQSMFTFFLGKMPRREPEFRKRRKRAILMIAALT